VKGCAPATRTRTPPRTWNTGGKPTRAVCTITMETEVIKSPLRVQPRRRRLSGSWGVADLTRPRRTRLYHKSGEMSNRGVQLRDGTGFRKISPVQMESPWPNATPAERQSRQAAKGLRTPSVQGRAHRLRQGFRRQVSVLKVMGIHGVGILAAREGLLRNSSFRGACPERSRRDRRESPVVSSAEPRNLACRDREIPPLRFAQVEMTARLPCGVEFLGL
jgi:hypothetical protein